VCVCFFGYPDSGRLAKNTPFSYKITRFLRINISYYIVPVTITKEFRFESAHYLPYMPEGHKCRRMHGHSFRVEVKLMGEPSPETGILMDFAEIKDCVKPFVESLDHWVINEVGEKQGDDLLQNPTSENIAKWFYLKLKPLLPALKSIVVHETCTSYCEYSE
jgi:6-pyruvoyltetrahydropterin/6-carboxytetrahydropterin synthase